MQIELVGPLELPLVMTTAPDRDGLFLNGVQLLHARDFSLHRFTVAQLPAAREYVSGQGPGAAQHLRTNPGAIFEMSCLEARLFLIHARLLKFSV